jgi:hypothetical protein
VVFLVFCVCVCVCGRARARGFCFGYFFIASFLPVLHFRFQVFVCVPRVLCAYVCVLLRLAELRGREYALHGKVYQSQISKAIFGTFSKPALPYSSAVGGGWNTVLHFVPTFCKRFFPFHEKCMYVACLFP